MVIDRDFCRRGGIELWWSRGENRFDPGYRSRINDLAGLWVRLV
jgi:hypothetical protein